MGLFSSKTKISVATSLNRVVEDERIPDTMKSALLEAIVQNESIPASLVNGLTNSATFRIDRMYRYARDHYVHGLPNATVHTNTGGEAAVRRVLERIAGQPVTLEYLRCAPPNLNHLAWQGLTDDWGYDYQSNEITSLSAQYGTPVYLRRFRLVYPGDLVAAADPDTLAALGPPSTRGYTPDRPATGLGAYQAHGDMVIDDALDAREHVEVVCVREEKGRLIENSFTLLIGSYNSDRDYFQAMYRWQQGNHMHYRFWTYRDGSGQWPEVDRLNNVSYENPGRYFPFVFFVSEGKDLTSREWLGTEVQETSRKLLDYMDMDYEKIGAEIQKSPDSDSLEQALMMLAVPMNAEDELGRRYLFEYFNHQYLANPTAPGGLKGKGRVSGSSNAIVMRDRDFEFALAYSRITRRLRAGRVAPVGHCSATEGRDSYEESYARREWTNGRGEDQILTRTITERYVAYQKQVSTGFYEEIRVHAPACRYGIYKKYGVRSELDSDSLIVPINRDIAELIPLYERERLYLRSMYFVFNAMEKTKVKWYQSSFFKAVITIAAVAITIYTGGAAFQTLAAAMAVGGVTALATTAITMVVKSLVFDYALELLTKQLGADVALIAGLVAASWAGAQALRSGSLQGTPWAEELLSAGSGLVQQSGSQYQNQLNELGRSYARFEQQQTTLDAELDHAQDLLATNALNKGLVAPLVRFGEAPELFYQRTIHSGNIGTTGLEAVSSFVDIALTLPDINATIGGAAHV